MYVDSVWKRALFRECSKRLVLFLISGSIPEPTGRNIQRRRLFLRAPVIKNKNKLGFGRKEQRI